MFSHHKLALLICATAVAVMGCSLHRDRERLYDAPTNDYVKLPTPGPSYLELSEPEIYEPMNLGSIDPTDISDYQSIQYTPITLEECIARALSTSEVSRDLGVAIIRTPGAMVTNYEPALAYSNARFGEEAALSEFDANVVANLFFQKNDRPFNNRFSGDVNGLFRQDLHTYNVEINKRAATGTLFALRHGVDYDANNQAGNRFGSAWQTIAEAEFRQPLMQGSGVLFNRIAGPSQQPGVYNGVLIARTNTEIGLTRFEQGIYNLVSNVENAYWDLFFAYRELEAQTAARDAALALYEKKKEGAIAKRVSSLDEVSAYEQYLRFENNIINSLEGRAIDGTRTDNGSAGGSFRNTIGVRAAERRLRYLLGMEITDGSLLQPADTPTSTPVAFDWSESVQSALTNRPELRQQRWVIKQKQLEYTAARNFLLPRIDLVGTQRFRGLGKNLTGGSNTFNDDIAANTDLSNAYGDLFSGDFQEWQLGAEIRMPVGFRRAHNAVRAAELSIQRERAVLKEQERMITLGLSNAVAELRRAFAAMALAEERYNAAYSYKAKAAELVENGSTNIDVQLEAERRVLEAKLQFLQAEVEYGLAIRNVHYEKGTLLEYNNVFLSEAESDPDAYRDAALRFAARKGTMSYVLRNPAIGRSMQAAEAQWPGAGEEWLEPATEVPFAEDVQVIDAPRLEFESTASPLTPMEVKPVPFATQAFPGTLPQGEAIGTPPQKPAASTTNLGDESPVKGASTGISDADRLSDDSQ